MPSQTYFLSMGLEESLSNKQQNSQSLLHKTHFWGNISTQTLSEEFEAVVLEIFEL